MRNEILGLVRHAMTTLGGYLVSSGILESSQIEGSVGAVMVLIGVGCSLYDKRGRSQ